MSDPTEIMRRTAQRRSAMEGAGPWVLVAHRRGHMTVLGPFLTHEEAYAAWAHVSSVDRVRKARPAYEFTFRALRSFRRDEWPL